MKTRTGYVSNSSSASFIVILKDDAMEGMAAVTSEQEQVLFNYGFRYVREYWKWALQNGSPTHTSRKSFKPDDHVSMTYDVSCNEDEVEDFLFKNHIPFVELFDYDTQVRHYDGIHDYSDVYLNAGKQFLTYGMDDQRMDGMMRKRLMEDKPFARIRISDGRDITDSIVEESK